MSGNDSFLKFWVNENLLSNISEIRYSYLFHGIDIRPLFDPVTPPAVQAPRRGTVEEWKDRRVEGGNVENVTIHRVHDVTKGRVLVLRDKVCGQLKNN